MRNALLAALAALVLFVQPAAAEPKWKRLPPTPTLPKADASGLAPVNGIRIWYASYGRGEPVLFVHGGLANADTWGAQVRRFSKQYRVIVMDSRGHGRSSRDARPFGYDLMADDVVGLLDYLKIRKVALVGWSDGAIIGLDIAMRHPQRLSKLFAFAANYNTAGVMNVDSDPIFTKFIARSRFEYEKLSPTPKGYDAFVQQIGKMWATQPNWTRRDLARIKTPTWIVDGDHDEVIRPDQPRTMADWIPNAGLLIQPDVSHFSIIQDPRQFNEDLARFLTDR